MLPSQAQYRPWIPTVIFAALPLLSALMTRLVPDTLHCSLPNSFADLETRSVAGSIS